MSVLMHIYLSALEKKGLDRTGAGMTNQRKLLKPRTRMQTPPN